MMSRMDQAGIDTHTEGAADSMHLPTDQRTHRGPMTCCH